MRTEMLANWQIFGCRDNREQTVRGHKDRSEQRFRCHDSRNLKDMMTCLNEEQRDLNLQYNASYCGSIKEPLQRSSCPKTLSN